MPEWWGLRVEGQLVRVIEWHQAFPPALSDFGPTVPGGVAYEITPLHVATVD